MAAESPINQQVINEAESIGVVSYLPPGEVTIVISLSEKLSSYMKGSVGFGFANAGSLTKYTLIPSGSSDSTWTASGSLTQNKKVYFDASTITTGIDVTGTLVDLAPVYLPASDCAISFTIESIGNLTSYRNAFGSQTIAITVTPAGLLQAKVRLPSASSEVLIDAAAPAPRTIFRIPAVTVGSVWSTAGTLYTKRTLSGTAGSIFTAYGLLSVGKRKYIGSTNVDLTTTMTGTLNALRAISGTVTTTIDIAAETIRKTRRLSGTSTVLVSPSGKLTRIPILSGMTNISINMTGRIGAVKLISGGTSFSTELEGDIANNASGVDLEDHLMFRLAINREMTR